MSFSLVCPLSYCQINFSKTQLFIQGTLLCQIFFDRTELEHRGHDFKASYTLILADFLFFLYSSTELYFLIKVFYLLFLW